MYENIGLNFNMFNQYGITNPFMGGGMYSSAYSNPFMGCGMYPMGCSYPYGGFSFNGDIASSSLFSAINFGLPYTSASPMFLPCIYPGGLGTGYFPDVSMLATPYMSFAGGGSMMSMPFSTMTSSTPKFTFTVPTITRPRVTSTPATSTSSGSTSSVTPHRTVMRYGKDLSPEFINKVKQVAMRLNCSYDDLLAVMNSESGLNPQAQNRSSGAVGLIQFTSVAIQELNKQHGLGLTRDKIKNMSAMEQLDLVEKFLLITKKRAFPENARLSGADLYSLIFLPGRASRDVLTRRGEGYYSANTGLDLDNDGTISKSDLAQRVESKKISLVA